MRKRPIQIILRLNEQERDHLKAQVALSGYSTEQYLRCLIAGENMCPRPPNELAEIKRQLAAIGNNINQLTRLSHIRGSVKAADLALVIRMQMQIWQRIKEL